MKDHSGTVGFYHKNNRKLPLIRLSGQWLTQNGFQIGRPIRVRVRPGSINLELQLPQDEPPQPIEGFLVMHHQGHYAICSRGLFHQLRRDDRVAVEMQKDTWVELKVMRDMEGYYLQNNEIAFYPKMVYGRLIERDGNVELLK